MWVSILVAVIVGVLVLWIALIGILWLQMRRMGLTVGWRDVLRLVPDVVRLVKRLAADLTVPRTRLRG